MSNPHSAAKLKTKPPVVSSSNVTVLYLGTATSSLDGPSGVAGIVTGYGLDGPGIQSRWGRDFPYLSRPALGLTQPPVQRVLGLSRE